MDLFGDTAGPHIAHFHVRHHDGRIELEWEVRNAPTLRWRVLRSQYGYADNAEVPGTNGQVLVNESSDTFLADEGLDQPHALLLHGVRSGAGGRLAAAGGGQGPATRPAELVPSADARHCRRPSRRNKASAAAAR